MAKPEKSITIKIDGKKHPFQEERKETTDRQLKVPTEQEEAFQWVLPDQTETPIDRISTTKVEDVRPKSKQRGTVFSFGRRNNQKWLSIMLTVLLAIFVGTGFGVMIKKYIIQDESIEQIMTPTNQAVSPSKNDKKTDSQAQESLVIPAQSIFVVQGGVFTTEEGAQQFIEELTSKEISATMIQLTGQTIVYLAVADSLEHAKEVGGIFKEKGVDVYAKQLEISEKQFAQLEEADKLFLQEAFSLFNQFTMNSNALLLGNTLPEGWKVAQAERVELIKELDVKNEKVTHLKNELLAVNTKLQESRETLSEAQFVQLQTHLLTFIGLFDSL